MLPSARRTTPCNPEFSAMAALQLDAALAQPGEQRGRDFRAISPEGVARAARGCASAASS